MEKARSLTGENSMDRLSEKIKIVYLTFVILFAGGVFLYLLDSWGMIRLDQYLPFITKSPPVVDYTQDSVTDLERERLRKEELRIEEENLRLQEEKERFEIVQSEYEEKMRKLEEMKRGLDDQKRILEENRKQAQNRKKMIEDMSRRIYAMRPDDAVAIVAGWSNTDLVDVFLQMEQNASDEGRQSIVPYLMTKMPKERASVITTLMMDEQARLSIDRSE